MGKAPEGIIYGGGGTEKSCRVGTTRHLAVDRDILAGIARLQNCMAYII